MADETNNIQTDYVPTLSGEKSDLQRRQNYVDVRIILSDSILPDDFAGVIRLKYNVAETETASMPVLFILLNSPHSYEGHILIPRSFRASKIFPSFVLKGHKYTATRPVDFMKVMDTYTQDDFTRAKISQKLRRLQFLALTVVLTLIVGFVLGYGSRAMLHPSAVIHDTINCIVDSDTTVSEPLDTMAQDTVESENNQGQVVEQATPPQENPANETAEQPSVKKKGGLKPGRKGFYYCKDNGGDDPTCDFALKASDTIFLRSHILSGKHIHINK